jgi:hypothetical protein
MSSVGDTSLNLSLIKEYLENLRKMKISTFPLSNEQIIFTNKLASLLCYNRPPLWSSARSSWLQNRDVLCFL